MVPGPEGETRSEWSAGRGAGLKAVGFSGLAQEVLSSGALGQWNEEVRQGFKGPLEAEAGFLASHDPGA